MCGKKRAQNVKLIVEKLKAIVVYLDDYRKFLQDLNAVYTRMAPEKNYQQIKVASRHLNCNVPIMIIMAMGGLDVIYCYIKKIGEKKC